MDHFLSLGSVLISGIGLFRIGLFGNMCGRVYVMGFCIFLFLSGVSLWVSGGSFAMGAGAKCYFCSEKAGLFEVSKKKEIVPKKRRRFSHITRCGPLGGILAGRVLVIFFATWG